MHWDQKNIGILGGGQLGKMLCEAAGPMNIYLHILDQDTSFPAAGVCPNFHAGDFRDYDDVMAFGKKMDVISIEIENVNTRALKHLETMGKQVYPQAHIIELIKDKGSQKNFYQEHHFHTSPFRLFESKKDIEDYLESHHPAFPVFQKSRTEGYDGRGVQKLTGKADLKKLWDVPSVLEEGVEIHKEIAVIVARDANGNTSAYPAVEMQFHPTANLLEFQKCPADISEELEKQARELATNLAVKMGIIGLLAVEMFIDKNGQILINEVAPRPHNSGHHTIEAHVCSQYEQLVRILTGLPLGSTKMQSPSLLINILGQDGYKGNAIYEGIEECLKLEAVHLHLYGKKITKAFRKMGHVCIVDHDLEAAYEKANFVRKHLRVIA